MRDSVIVSLNSHLVSKYSIRGLSLNAISSIFTGSVVHFLYFYPTERFCLQVHSTTDPFGVYDRLVFINLTFFKSDIY